MANRSADFLEVDDYEYAPNLRRARSGGYADHLENKEKWERQDRERQMKRYHDSRSSRRQQLATERLYVPTFDTTGHRRVRSHDGIRDAREEPVREYSVRVHQPSSDRFEESPRPERLPTRPSWKPQRGRPAITVQIHQDNVPSTALATQPKKSPRGSPRSGSAQSQLLFQYITLQNKLADISAICAPNAHIEATSPGDLTFSKISEEVEGYAFQLKAWSYVVNLENMERFDVNKRQTVELTSHTLDRLMERVSELSTACARAKPRDLKIGPLLDVNEDNEWESYGDSGDEDENGNAGQVMAARELRSSANEQNSDGKDVTDSLGFAILSHLSSIRLQIQTLSKLTRTLQEATPDAKDEVIAIRRLVAEVDRFFGSQDSLHRYSIDSRFEGGEALEEARHANRLYR